MKNIRYIGTDAICRAFYHQTGIVWTTGKVDTVLDERVAAKMLEYTGVFEDAGDSSAVAGGADGALTLTPSGLTKGGVALTAAEMQSLQLGAGIVISTDAPSDSDGRPDGTIYFHITG